MKNIFLIAAMILSSTILSAQQRTITGNVVDAVTAEPVIGAVIAVEGSTNATVTGTDGTFSLSNVAVGATLSVTSFNYQPQTVIVGQATSYSVRMETDAQIIDDVVVVGFGTQTKGNLTGSYGIATSEEIKDRPVLFASQMLQGLVPGMNITQDNGSLGSRPSINVRGRGGVGGNNPGSGQSNPIVLIDGVAGDINTINPADIDHVTVLMDAAASSIYGSQAAFGVILVTTKRGVQGNTRINYSNNFRWSSPITLPETPDSVTFAAYFNDASYADGSGQHFNEAWMKALVDFQAGKFANDPIYRYGATPRTNNTWEEGFDPNGIDPNGSTQRVGGIANNNFYKELFLKSAFAQEHNLSFSGGSGRTNYYTSFNYVDQQGLQRFGGDNYDRFSASARIGYEVMKWIDFTYNIRYSRDIYNRPNSDYGYNEVGRQTWPMLPLYDGNGNLRARIPLAAEMGGDRIEKTDNLTQRAQFVFEPIQDWRTTLELAYSNRFNNTHYESYPTYGADGGYWDLDGRVISRTSGSSSIREDATFRNQFTMNLFSEYKFKLAEDHNFKVMAGMQQLSEQQKAFGIQKYGVLLPDFPEIGLTTDLNNAGNSATPQLQNWADDNNRERNYQTALIGVFGRVNYDYKGRYLFEANLRYDETSRYRAGHRAVWAPSFSAGWNIAQENFMESASGWLSMLKLRGSYGEIANQATRSYYPTYSNVSIGLARWWWNGNTRPNSASSPGILESPYMMWSRVVTADIGLDFAMLDDRLSGTFDWFNRRNTDQLGDPVRLPSILGVTPPFENNLETKDVGFELSLGWKDKLQNGLSYGVRFLLSDYQTTVVKYPGNPTLNINNNANYAGKKMGDIWGYVTKGIARTQEEWDAHARTTDQTYIASSNWGVGDIMYTDLDGDGKINQGANTLNDPGDRKVIGNDTPRYVFSLDLTAAWKGFDFRAFFSGVGKRDFAAGGTFFWGATGNMWWNNCFTGNLDYWRDENSWSVINGYMTENNDDPYFARAKDDAHNVQTQSRYIQNAAYIRLKNLQIGYTLPQRWTQKISLDQARIFFSAENLLTFSPIYGLFDPETAYGNSTNSQGGGNVYPLSKVISFGLNLNF
jgi:TonB-linked SusC/RagA family outer membrane protein